MVRRRIDVPALLDVQEEPLMEHVSPGQQSPVARPFLRWAGGKSKWVRVLAESVPELGSYDRYFEPFVGAGALFFAVCPDRAVLSDSNGELMNCYRQVARNPLEVWGLLERYRERDSREFYYSVRSQKTESMSVIERAARFIYLNKAAFNGIYRVNTRGEFNVPYGPSSRGPAIPTKSSLEGAGWLLAGAQLITSDYQMVCRLPKRGDFVYLDPPYPPLDGASSFRHYTAQRFGWKDQEEVARTFNVLDRRGCLVMLSNSDCDMIRSMYRGFLLRQLSITRWLGANGNRFQVKEIIVTNYQPSTERWVASARL